MLETFIASFAAFCCYDFLYFAIHRLRIVLRKRFNQKSSI